MTIEGWEHVPNGKMPLSEQALSDGNSLKTPDDLGPSPPYEEVAQHAPTHRYAGPSRLHILGATWGGVDVTAEIQGTVTLDSSGDFETATLNLHTMHTALLPDPAVGVIKTLTVLYHYSDDPDADVQLLNATQFAPQITVHITPTSHREKAAWGLPSFFVGLRGTAWRDPGGRVEIIAVLYGTQRIQTPSVLEELARFFEGRRGQIRTTSSFFRTNPWVGMRKSWTVYFRFLNSPTGRVRLVTGMEDAALEVPWNIGE